MKIPKKYCFFIEFIKNMSMIYFHETFIKKTFINIKKTFINVF